MEIWKSGSGKSPLLYFYNHPRSFIAKVQILGINDRPHRTLPSLFNLILNKIEILLDGWNAVPVDSFMGFLPGGNSSIVEYPNLRYRLIAQKSGNRCGVHYQNVGGISFLFAILGLFVATPNSIVVRPPMAKALNFLICYLILHRACVPIKCSARQFFQFSWIIFRPISLPTPVSRAMFTQRPPRSSLIPIKCLGWPKFL